MDDRVKDTESAERHASKNPFLGRIACDFFLQLYESPTISKNPSHSSARSAMPRHRSRRRVAARTPPSVNRGPRGTGTHWRWV